MEVSSAGLGAVVGHGADERTARAAEAAGVSVEGHVARQFSGELGRHADLILVMEAEHRRVLAETHPEFSGKVMLFDHWIGGAGIPDPHGKPFAAHEAAVERIIQAAEGWVGKLGRTAP